MFKERLRELGERVGGVLAVSLVGQDGIPVESVSHDELDVEILAAELMNQMRSISSSHREIAVGQVRQFSITTDRYTVMIGALSDEYYLLLVLDDTSRHGRARFELRRAGLLFEDDLM